MADDQDHGARAIGPDVREDGDPLHAIVERYRRRRPASAGWSSAERAAWLAELALERAAQAVVFEIAAFDHPSGWDHPRERAALASAGVASVVLPPDAWRSPDAAAVVAVVALASSTPREAARV